MFHLTSAKSEEVRCLSQYTGMFWNIWYEYISHLFDISIVWDMREVCSIILLLNMYICKMYIQIASQLCVYPVLAQKSGCKSKLHG